MIPVLPSHLSYQFNQQGTRSRTSLTRDSTYRPIIRIAIVILLSSLFLVFLFTSLLSHFPIAIQEAATGSLYRFHRQKGKHTPFTHFTTQNSIFTKRISLSSLNSLLKTRRRLIGGTVNNSLIVACSNLAHIHPQILTSWVSTQGVREIILVHDNPSAEQSERALRAIDSVDRLGRIIYVNLVSPSPTATTTTTTSTATTTINTPSPPSSNDSIGDTDGKENEQHQQRQEVGPQQAQQETSFPPVHTQRWFRSRAFNIGVSLASGANILLSDCRTMIAADALTSHPLPMNVFYVSVGHQRSHISDMRPIQLIYVRKRDFTAIHGFDERIDVPGFDMPDLIQRLSHLIPDLSWNPMHPDASHVIDMPGSVALAEKHRVSGARTLDKGAALIPELALHVSTFARDEVDPWKGDGGATVVLRDSVMSLKDVDVRVLRSHYESVQGHARKLTMFVPNMRSDFKLWLHATVRTASRESMIGSLSREVTARVVLKAHRKLLHDHHGIPWNLLSVIEGADNYDGRDIGSGSRYTNTNDGASDSDLSLLSGSTDGSMGGNGSWLENDQKGAITPLTELERKIETYAPILVDVLWRKTKLLVVNIEADYAMELFRGVSWAISLAVARNRALMIVGDLQGTPLVQLLDLRATSDVLLSEYNIQLDIMGRMQLVNCSVESVTSCWRDDDVVVHAWDEYRVKDGISGLPDNAARHTLLHVAGRDIVQWDEQDELTAWQQQLEMRAFACISVSDQVKGVVRDKVEQGWDEIANRTALWVTRSSRDKQTVKAFAYGYLKHLEQRRERGSKRGRFSFGYDYEGEAMKAAAVKMVMGLGMRFGGRGGGNKKMAALLFMSDHAEMRGRMEAVAVLNSVQNVGDLLLVMQCRRIVFDSEEVPQSWKGTDGCLMEWRRVHGLGGGGVLHVRSSDVGADVSFHEMELSGGRDEEELDGSAEIRR